MSQLPLVVDLDGTLLHSDLLLESGFAFLREQPLQAFALPAWLAGGKANLKNRLAAAVDIDVTHLPYDERVITLITDARKQGRTTVLATASHQSYADRIAEHLKIFDRVLATHGELNLSAHNKRDVLVQEFGDKGFDYVGNSRDDLPVWAAANRAYVVNPEPGVEARAQRQGNVESVMPSQGSGLRTWMRALRLHQWLKNLLIFVPLLASHQLLHADLLLKGLLAFLCFGLCASSVYILNDLLDLADDRQHERKRHRPFASGQASIKAGLLAFPLLLAAAIGIAALLLPPAFAAALGVYYVMTLLYSFMLKRIMTVDVMVLALLYTMRIIAGTFAFEVTLTFWMLAFSMFIFLSLALVKRYAELRDARQKGRTEKTHGRGYYPDDLEMISSLGAASGYLAVMVLALYIQDPATVALYHHPHVIWLACPLLLFWISRTWLLTHRGQMHDDPILFAAKDRISLLTGALFCLIFWLAA